ncbi:hypothetical protein K439DRAFT_1367852, partial [Ramaria rubella]
MLVDYSELIKAVAPGYVPTAFEAANIQTEAEEQCRELCSVDEQIASLKEQLSELRTYRNNLCRSYVSASSLRAPIRRVPQEVLGEIFAHLIP